MDDGRRRCWAKRGMDNGRRGAMGNPGHLGNEVHLHETIILVPLHLIQNMLSAQ